MLFCVTHSYLKCLLHRAPEIKCILLCEIRCTLTPFLSTAACCRATSPPSCTPRGPTSPSSRASPPSVRRWTSPSCLRCPRCPSVRLSSRYSPIPSPPPSCLPPPPPPSSSSPPFPPSTPSIPPPIYSPIPPPSPLRLLLPLLHLFLPLLL